MQTIFEQVQPYVTTIVLAVIGLLVTFILGVINTVKAKIVAYFDAKLSTEQRALLHRIAGEAYAYAEATFRDGAGHAKLEEAMQYASKQLKKRGIEVAAVELQAAIEKAWLEYRS